VIEPGRTGWLAEGPDDWRATLDAVLGDADARSRVGARAQREALLRWSPHLQGARYLAILEQIVASTRGARRQPAPTWEPVLLDEPFLANPTPLEPYPPGLQGSTRGRRRPRRRVPLRVVVRTKVRRLRESLADEGVGGAIRGATRVGARGVRRLTGRSAQPSGRSTPPSTS
jgi:hypothetical protein